MPKWLTAPIVASVIFGSLSGAVFTAWYNRKVPVIIGYDISSTSTGDDRTTKSLVKDLKLRIGDRDIESIHTHIITLGRTSGYADRVDLALTFPEPVEVFGSTYEAPSPVHNLSCTTLPTGAKCEFGPLDGKGQYRISLATNVATPPKLAIAGEAELLPFQEIARRNPSFGRVAEVLADAGLPFLVIFVVYFYWKDVILDRRRQ